MTSSDVDDWRGRSLAELVHYIIQTHHAALRTALPALQAAMADAMRADATAATREGRAADRLIQQFRLETENHLRKEEAVLFPLITQLEVAVAGGDPPPRYGFGTLGHLIEIMEEEHALTHHQLDRLTAFFEKAAARHAEAWAHPRCLLAAVVADMAVHTRLEDGILFPRTIRFESDRE